MVRDYKSLNFANKYFHNIRRELAPDTAYALGDITIVDEPVVDVIFLMRTDLEKKLNKSELEEVKRSFKNLNITYEVWDFPVKSTTHLENPQGNFTYESVYPQIRVTQHRDIYDSLELKLKIAQKVLSRGKITITDRLHASIISNLINKPVIYYDNIYGKIYNVRSTVASLIPVCNDEILNSYQVTKFLDCINIAKELLGIAN